MDWTTDPKEEVSGQLSGDGLRPQPALVSDQAVARLAPSGFDQAREDRTETVTVPKAKYDALVEHFDRHEGTPCAQIRWQDRECELLAHICGNASMEEYRIAEMGADQMRELLLYIAKDARRVSGYGEPKDAAAWVEAYADGRI